MVSVVPPAWYEGLFTEDELIEAFIPYLPCPIDERNVTILVGPTSTVHSPIDSLYPEAYLVSAQGTLPLRYHIRVDNEDLEDLECLKGSVLVTLATTEMVLFCIQDKRCVVCDRINVHDEHLCIGCKNFIVCPGSCSEARPHSIEECCRFNLAAQYYHNRVSLYSSLNYAELVVLQNVDVVRRPPFVLEPIVLDVHLLQAQ